MRRRRLALLLLFLPALVACSREPALPAPPPPTPRSAPASPFAGCYSIEPALAFTATERVGELRLDPPHTVLDPGFTACPRLCSWEEKDGEVTIGIGTGFVGWSITARPTARGLEGTASFDADVPVPPDTHKVVLTRKSCE